MTFRDSYDALFYGRTCTPAQVEKLQDNRVKKIQIAFMLRNENQIAWALHVAGSAMLDREAIEAHKRKRGY